jgi:hemolysin III
MYKGERLNAYTHLLGLFLSIAGAVWLARRIAAGADAPTTVVGCVAYATALVSVYLTSTIFHSARGRSKAFWARADHCAIYVLIAGTYTGLVLLAKKDAPSIILLGGVWALAIYGIVTEIRSSVLRPSVDRYLFVGWAVLAAVVPVMMRMDLAGQAALVGGAVVYSVGTLFYRNARRWVHSHGVWHMFVLGGSVCHFFAVASLLR